MWKTHLVDCSYKGGIWNTCVEDSNRRLVWKTSLEDSFMNIIKDAYGTLVWKTQVEDSSGRFVLKTPFIKIIKDAYGRLVWKTHLEDSSGRVVWNTFIGDSYGILMFIYCKYFICQNVLILWQRVEMFGRLVLNISSTISILTVHRI